MIVSIHIPKTAGTSFGMRLEDKFGLRLLKDYGDWVGLDTPEANALRAARDAETRARRDELLRDYDIIHGHFVADKYVGLFPVAAFTAFFRDPYQRAVSHYEFLLRYPKLDHPWIRQFHESRPALADLLKLFPNYQSIFLGQVAIEDFAVVGLTEQYERSVALFEAVFGRKLPPEVARGNVNPDREGDAYPIDPAVRRAIDIHHAADVELYRRACERFAQLAARYNV